MTAHSTRSTCVFRFDGDRTHSVEVEPHTIPPVDAIDADGNRIRIEVGTPRDTVSDLAVALGGRAPFGLEIGGVVVASQRPLIEVESLVEGARVAPADGPCGTTSSPDMSGTFEFAIVAGPSCRPWAPLAPGRHGVGRSPAVTVHLDDPSVELHHALLVVDGAVRILQLTGRTPIDVITSDRSAPVVDEVGGVAVRPGDVVAIGTSRMALRVSGGDDVPPSTRHDVHASTVGPAAGDPWHLELRRGPATPEDADDVPITLPAPSPRDAFPSATALVGAGVAAAGAVVLAFVLGQAMFAVFALVGAIASFATWAVGVLGVVRRRARARRSGRAADELFERRLGEHHRVAGERHRARNPELVELVDDALGERRLVWSRRTARDGLRVVIGRGTLMLHPTLESDGFNRPEPSASQLAAVQRASSFDDVAIPVVIAPSEALGVTGSREAVAAILRSFVVQIATTIGPADVRIVVVSDDGPGWEWVSWLPHARAAPGEVLVFGTHELERLADVVSTTGPLDDRRTVLIVDTPAALTVRTGPLRRFVGSDRVSTIVGCVTGAGVPSVCRRVLTIGSTGRAEWSGPRRDDDPTIGHVVTAGVGEPVARRVALALGGLVDPENVSGSTTGLPATLAFSALRPEAFGRGAAGIVEEWRAGGDDPPLAVVVGASADGVVELDLDRDGPHALIAGTTGSGKSELLRTMVVGLAARVSPAHLHFVFVDYKGGATFDGCRALPHTVGVVTDLDGGLAERALSSLDAELARREHLFRDAAVADLREYRTRGRAPLARLVVMIDEFASMAHDVPGFLSALVGIAQRGRSLGVHLVLATQRPAGVVNDDIRANTNLRLALRVNDRADGIDVVGDALPATFPRQLPGRCAVRLGHDELVVFQAASTAGPRPTGRRALSVRRWPPGPTASANPTTPTDPGDDELSVLVDSIRHAAEMTGAAADGRVWLEPLPAVLEAGAVADCVAYSDGDAVVGVHDAVGLIDDPARQMRRPLRWDVTAGNLLLVGTLGSGVTSTIVSLAAAACRMSSPDHLHLYVIDGYGDRSLDGVAQIAHCGGVIRLGDAERVERLLRRLDAEIDRRAAGSDDVDPTILLMIDGIGPLRRSLDTVDRLPVLAVLDRVLEAGPAAGITTCCSTDGANAGTPVPAADRWVFAVDEHAAAHLGVRAVSGDRPPGRLRIMSSGLDAQVALGADGLAALSGRESGVGPRAVEVLPAWIDPAELPASSHRSTTGRSVRQLVVGRRADDLEPAVLEVPAGDHIFIGGAGRTGTSTVLAQVAAAWRSLEGDGSVVEWSRSSQDSSVALAGPGQAVPGRMLLVIDDAERVDDTDGVIASILRRSDGVVTIAAAARLDAVRAAYGHWIREIVRSRCGVIMTAPGEIDGDLLGVVLPRRTPIPARPGLGWIIDGRGHRLVQFAGRLPS